MTDKLTLKLNDKTVEVTMDDNGRYCLNDLYRASGSDRNKRTANFLRSNKASKTGDNKKPTKYLRKNVGHVMTKQGTETDTCVVEPEVVITGKGRGSKTFASRRVFDEYAKFLGLVKIDDVTYDTDPLKKKNNKPDILYIISNKFGFTKIGIASNLDKRLKSIEMASGVPCEKVLEFHIGDNAYDVEQELHENFKEYRTVGEWFDFTKSGVNYLKCITELLKERGIVND